MDFVECGCGVRSRRTHLSRSGQLQSLMGTNGHAGCEQCGWRNVFMRGHADGATYRRPEHGKFTNSPWKSGTSIREPCQIEPDVCADAAAVPAARAYAPTDYQSFPEPPDGIHHTDLGFYRYFASSLSRFYFIDARCEYALRSPTITPSWDTMGVHIRHVLPFHSARYFYHSPIHEHRHLFYIVRLARRSNNFKSLSRTIKVTLVSLVIFQSNIWVCIFSFMYCQRNCQFSRINIEFTVSFRSSITIGVL